MGRSFGFVYFVFRVRECRGFILISFIFLGGFEGVDSVVFCFSFGFYIFIVDLFKIVITAIMVYFVERLFRVLFVFI